MQTQSKSRWDWLSAVLFVVAMLTSSGRLAVTGWTPDLETAQVMAGIGGILGLALGYSFFGRRGVFGLGIGYFVVLFPLYLAWLEDPSLLLQERLLSLGGRLLFALGQLFQGQPVEDPIFLITLLSILFWIIALVSGFLLQRYASLLGALIPAGVALLVIHGYNSFQGKRLGFVALYLFLSLALVGRLYYLQQRSTWQAKRMYVNPESDVTMLNGIVIAAGAVIFLAWSLPLSATSLAVAAEGWKQLMNPIDEMREDMSDAFAAIENTVTLRRAYFGDILMLGTGVPENETTVFTVEITDQPTYTVPRLYWRGRVYDFYDGRQWLTSPSTRVFFEPENGDIVIPDRDQKDVMDIQVQTFTTQNSLLYTMSQPLWVSRPGSMQVHVNESAELDLVLFNPDPGIAPGEFFEMRAAVHNPTIAELRAAGEEYPEWVTAYYLQLPDNFSPRFQELALEITETAETPYDKAALITFYLRREIDYTRTIPNPPFGRDPLEWVIFDHKQGFCNYYATAEVLMLRSLGVPARVALGYAQGEYDQSTGKYTVRQSDFHSWPEVYFPGIGWVEFEPTVSQEALVRPRGIDSPVDTSGAVAGEDPLLDDELIDPDRDAATNELDSGPLPAVRAFFYNWQPVLNTLGWVAAIGLVIWLWYLDQQHHVVDRIPGFIKNNLERRNITTPRWLDRWAFYVTLAPIMRAYRIIPLSLRWLGQQPDLAQTPAQHAAQLTALLPQSQLSIKNLVQEYQLALYSPQAGDLLVARRSNRLILQAALQARWKYLIKLLRQHLPFQ